MLEEEARHRRRSHASGKKCRSTRVAHACTIPTIRFGGLARRRSVVTSEQAVTLVPAVSLHVPSKWMFQKYPSRPSIVYSEKQFRTA